MMSSIWNTIEMNLGAAALLIGVPLLLVEVLGWLTGRLIKDRRFVLLIKTSTFMLFFALPQSLRYFVTLSWLASRSLDRVYVPDQPIALNVFLGGLILPALTFGTVFFLLNLFVPKEPGIVTRILVWFIQVVLFHLLSMGFFYFIH